MRSGIIKLLRKYIALVCQTKTVARTFAWWIFQYLCTRKSGYPLLKHEASEHMCQNVDLITMAFSSGTYWDYDMRLSYWGWRYWCTKLCGHKLLFAGLPYLSPLQTLSRASTLKLSTMKHEHIIADWFNLVDWDAEMSYLAISNNVLIEINSQWSCSLSVMWVIFQVVLIVHLLCEQTVNNADFNVYLNYKKPQAPFTIGRKNSVEQKHKLLRNFHSAINPHFVL